MHTFQNLLYILIWPEYLFQKTQMPEHVPEIP